MNNNQSVIERFREKFPNLMAIVIPKTEPYKLVEKTPDVENFLLEELNNKDKEWEEKIRDVFYNLNDKEEDFELNQKLLQIRNDILNEIE
jgi:ABC-type phosphate/phosphonate transport system substrate-binding protein